MATSPQALAQLQAALDANPRIRQLGQEWTQTVATGMPRASGAGAQLSAQITQELSRSGITIPPDYALNVNGQLEHKSFAERHPNLIMLAAGGMVGAGFLLPAGAAAGGGSAAAGSGVGATGAGAASLGAGAGTAAGSTAAGIAAGAAGAGTAAGLAGGGSGVSDAIKQLLKVGLPLGAFAATRSRGSSMPPLPGGSGGMGAPGSGPLNDELSQLMALSRQRLERTGPLQDAAIQLASRMGPSANAPRVQQASQIAHAPRPQQAMNPAVSAMIQQLLQSRGR